ncbi:MAG: GGDEF domain-containing protein [Gammaproteobacteria bacterium]|jgi:diguanylate cyclase
MHNKPELNPYTLGYRDPDTERAYRIQYARWLRTQSRVAIIVGLIIYVIYGLIDLHLPDRNLPLIWILRGTAMAIAVATYAYTYTPTFNRINQIPMALAGIAAAGGLIAIQQTMSFESSIHYFPGLILAIFWTYMFLGIRFINALVACLIIQLAYNLSLLLHHQPPLSIYLEDNFHLFAANLIGAASSYILEHQRRELFHKQRQLDRERRMHEQLSLQDNLTGLHNRRHLERALEEMLLSTHPPGMLSAGLFIDIDNFKPINDRHGHDTGDRVLQAISGRIAHTVRDTDLVARLGGDEFFVVLKSVPDREQAIGITRKLLTSLHERLMVETASGRTISLHVAASVGIVFFPFPTATPAEILRRADMAMYRVKNEGRNNWRVFDADLDDTSPGLRTRTVES